MVLESFKPLSAKQVTKDISARDGVITVVYKTY